MMNALLFIMVMTAAAQHPSWSFSDPQSWLYTYPSCSDNMQSPLMLTTRDAAHGVEAIFRTSKDPFFRTSSSGVGSGGSSFFQTMSSAEDGSSGNTDGYVFLNTSKTNHIMFTELLGTLYGLKQVQFFSPALHVLDGVRHNLEIVLKYQPLDTYSTNNVDVMMSFLYKDTGVSGVSSNHDLLAFLTGEVDVPLVNGVTMNVLQKGVLTYPGSMPYPPCTEDIFWAVATTVLSAPTNHINALMMQTTVTTKVPYDGVSDVGVAAAGGGKFSRKAFPSNGRNVVDHKLYAQW